MNITSYRSAINKPLLVNIGCRNKPLPAFVNVDINPENRLADVIDDGMTLSKFDEESIDEIHAVHMAEHLTGNSFNTALENWYRKLKPGGWIVLSVPDMEKASALLLLTKNKNIVKSLFYGSQNEGDEWDYHRSLHTETSLSDDLLKAGFKNIQKWNYWEKFPYNFCDTYASAVYPHMLKRSRMDNGREIDLGGIQLSLNLEAQK